MSSVLFVVSAAQGWTLADGTVHPTGFWAEELAEPHRLFTEAGWDITIATPGAVKPTVDAGSLAPQAAGGEDRAAELEAYLASIDDRLAAVVDVASVRAADFDAVFYPGGHAPMEDLAVDTTSGALMTAALDEGIPLAVLCHAPAALLAARRQDGSWPFAGYRMTSFTDEEERIGGLADKARWLVETELVGRGAEFVGGAPFEPHVEQDRGLLTGQNPASSERLARAVLDSVG
ncbi:putative intracellular protease/amidase [Sanguibacter keddieii DSM 10542]|uniref:Intracellular protease/amidase n=1 Tax=Sanguibacter keddieii (strain ATCC 51767 / DSM 10542 / NCFB 3025 / ST-74) TaxID=446469 RepID=D1BK30_SANKS|nr:type 1 glutamine amidotransferase domain-containing protein [Sanguibacter keddieii]ACZ22439.1 putative intracellular protease/amidase [Sanguibacter keddieii DSM 10542]